ncbi:hypothetical protein QJQ45_008616 [Haematococcus lacustris]|nr:hypothetical protein QJQ45_008616 [Haematococcus lacustris]
MHEQLCVLLAAQESGTAALTLPVPLDSNSLSDEAVKQLLADEEEKRKLRRRSKGRIRELTEIRAELAEKELILLEKEQELLERDQTLTVLKEEAEVQRLRDVEQLLTGTVDGLQGDLDDLQAAHQCLQDEHTALQQVASKAAATNHSLQAARRRLQGRVHIYRHKRRPHYSPLTFKQRQQLLVLEQHPVSVEVLRRCAEAGYGRLDGHGRPMGSMAEQLSPAGLAPSPTDIFIPTQEGPVGRPAARTAPYNAHHCLSTVRLHLETGVRRRALSKCRQFFVSEQCVLTNPHRPDLAQYWVPLGMGAWGAKPQVPQLLQDNSLLLRLSVVAVVGESFLVPELMWASKDDGLHAFELYRHTQDEHCGAMWTYYQHHVQAQMALPHLFAALGSSDQATRMEVAIDVVYHAELRLPPPEDGQQQQQQQRMQQQQQQQEDPYGTWRQYASDIRAMAVNGDPGSPALRLHLEQYYLASPISNAPVESLLQLLKHGGGRYMELPALLQLMSLHTCKEAMKTVDVHDLQQHMGQLRAEVRRKEDATAAAQRSAKAERQITDAAHKVGRVVINVGDHACQERLAAAHALAFGGRDYGHTTVEEAMKMTGKQLQSYLQFHKQEVHTSWRVPKLQSHVCTHIRGKLAAAAPPQQQLTPAGTIPELAVPAGAPPQQQQQLAAASTSRKREASAANKSRAAKQGASNNGVAKRASVAPRMRQNRMNSNSPTELSAPETVLATPHQSSGDARWGRKRPRTCLGRGAQQQLTVDQQLLQDAQRQVALDQQQLQGAQHQLAVDQQQLKGAQQQLALDLEKLQGAQHQLGLDQQQLKGAQHQLALDLEKLQGAQKQQAQALEQLQNSRTGLERSELLLRQHMDACMSSYMTLTVHLLKEYARGCLGWKGKRLTQNKPLLRADILEHLRWEQEMEEDQLAEVGVDEADDM